jgi:lipopolysaccharide/colanic/teichoic acid biosynthesis glycosyltransferase
MEHARSPDVEQAARRLRRPRARGALALKRALDVLLAAVMLAALSPLLLLVVAVLVGGAGGDWLETRVRLGRDGRPIRLYRFRELPGTLGRALERLGAREAPLLLSVISGRLSFVGPRPLPAGIDAGHTGPRRLMAPGLIGPAQRWGDDGPAGRDLDDAYVAEWSLWGDVRLLAGLERAAGAAARTGTGYGRK